MRRLLLSGLILLCIWMPSHSQKESGFVSLNDQLLFSKDEIYIKEGRTLVPAKKLLDGLHIQYYVNLEKKYLKAHQEKIEVKIPLDANYAYINDERQLINVGGEVKDNQVYIPLRFVSEAFGADVLWLQDQGRVAIYYWPFRNFEVLEILETIRGKPEDKDISYTLERQKFKAVLTKVDQTKEAYLKEETHLIRALKALGVQANIKVEDNHLKAMLADYHRAFKPIYEKSDRTKPWIYEDDYYFLTFDQGYYYGYYKNYQANGYRFGYTTFEEGYILSLVPYKDNKRQGIGYKAVYSKNDVFIYDMFFKMDRNMGVGLEYVRYKNGLETFDRSDKTNDTLVYIDERGHVFIPPLEPDLVGVGYYQWPATLEYIGFYDQNDRLGQGMYFGLDDNNLQTDNLLRQRSLEVVESLKLDHLSPDQQIKKIHDYLALNIRYDNSPLPMALSHTAYGALILGQAVCDGYAESFKYLLDLLGIENHLIFGRSNGEDHAWNLIKINGVYQHYDLTWNDDDKGQTPVYTYYSRSSEFFNKTHQWDHEKYEVYLGNKD